MRRSFIQMAVTIEIKLVWPKAMPKEATGRGFEPQDSPLT